MVVEGTEVVVEVVVEDGLQVVPDGQMDVVGIVVVEVDVDDTDVVDGVQVSPVGHIVDVVDAVVGVDVVVEVDVEDGVQVKPVGHMVVVV